MVSVTVALFKVTEFAPSITIPSDEVDNKEAFVFVHNLIDRLTDYFIETLEIYDYFITAYGLDVLTTNLYIANTHIHI